MWILQLKLKEVCDINIGVYLESDILGQINLIFLCTICKYFEILVWFLYYVNSLFRM